MMTMRSPIARSGAPSSRRKRFIALAAAVPLAVALAACSGSGDPAPSEPGGSAAPDLGDCGTIPLPDPQDPDGAVAALDESLQEGFAGFGYPTFESAWKDWSADGPIRVGYSALPLLNTWSYVVKDTLESRFAEASADGLTEGELVERIMPDPATMTPAEQIRGYQELVREGVDVILLSPLAGEAMVDVVNEAGEAGIPTITINGTVPSPYAVNFGHSPYFDGALPASEIVKQLGGSGDVLIVRGVPGVSTDTYAYEGIQAVLDGCPGINVVGEVEGGFNPPAAKAAVTQFLASHPGQIDAVLQSGVMAPGIFDAFEQLGRPTPKVGDNGSSAASLAFWQKAIDNDPAYENAGTGNTGAQQADLLFDIALRMAAGEGVSVSNITYPPVLLTNDNFGDWAVPGADTTSPDETRPGAPILTKEQFDLFFVNPN